MEFSPTRIPDVMLLQPKALRDERGFFMETFREEAFAAHGISGPFVQDNHTGSRQGVLRGLHYQIQQAQGKLIRVVRGTVFDVCVDLRRSSPTFGRWTGEELSEDNSFILWVPAGFAHGFYVQSESAEVVYKADNYYAPQWERTLLWNDPALGIEWPLKEGQAPILSVKDARGRPLSEADLFD